MSETERLYYADSFLLEFEAVVLAVTPHDERRSVVLLDRTAFYPTGGGQPTDTGMLGEHPVVECIDEDARGVLHVIEGAPTLAIGASINGRVDAARRLDHLQQHTAQHILSRAFIELFNAPTNGFRIMDGAAEIDIMLEHPSDERIEQAVDLANQIIWQNRPIHIRNVTAEEAARMPLRKRPERTGNMRIIEIEDFDLNACGGTHAGRTGEVGLLAVRSSERAKGMTRVEFIAGNRALADYRRANDIARQIAKLFSVAPDEAVVSVSRLLEENKHLTRRISVLEVIAAGVEANELLREATLSGTATKIVTRIFDERDAESLKRLAQALIAQSGVITLLASRNADSSARLIFARASDASGDMNLLMREACRMIDGGRGGGRPDLAQGGGRCSAELLADVVDNIAESLRSQSSGSVNA